MSNIMNYLEELKLAKKQRDFAEDEKVVLAKEFYKKTNEYNKQICQNNQKINQILHKNITARIGDIVKHLSTIWNIPVEQLEIFGDSWLAETWDKNANVEQIIERKFFNFDLKKPKNLSFRVQDTNGTRQTVISTFADTSTMQLDGKPLHDHLRISISPYKTSFGHYKIVLDAENITDLVLPFCLAGLLNINTNPAPQPANSTAQAIILAATDLEKEYSQNNFDTHSEEDIDNGYESELDDDPTYW